VELEHYTEYRRTIAQELRRQLARPDWRRPLPKEKSDENLVAGQAGHLSRH
jgi:hypothetical protein